MKRYKEFQDTEVRVIKNMFPHGLECQQLDGQTVFVGFANIDTEAKKIKEKSIVTVKYEGVNINNKLIKPTFYRSRNNKADMSWSELVLQYEDYNKQIPV